MTCHRPFNGYWKCEDAIRYYDADNPHSDSRSGIQTNSSTNDHNQSTALQLSLQSLSFFVEICGSSSLLKWFFDIFDGFKFSKIRRILRTFQHHFKICLLWILHKKECSFYTHLFCCTEIKWLFINSTAIWVTGSDTSSVAFRARSQLTRSKCKWTRIWNV